MIAFVYGTVDERWKKITILCESSYHYSCSQFSTSFAHTHTNESSLVNWWYTNLEKTEKKCFLLLFYWVCFNVRDAEDECYPITLVRIHSFFDGNLDRNEGLISTSLKSILINRYCEQFLLHVKVVALALVCAWRATFCCKNLYYVKYKIREIVSDGGSYDWFNDFDLNSKQTNSNQIIITTTTTQVASRCWPCRASTNLNRVWAACSYL